MAVQTHGTHKVSIIWAAGAFAFAVLLALFLIGGHNNGQPSAKNGPGNPMQTDQGR